MDEKGNLPEEKAAGSDKPVVEEKKDTNKTKTPAKESNASKLADVGPKTKFLGFFRLNENANWNLHPQMLASEDSVITKIALIHGECDVHIINVELPK